MDADGNGVGDFAGLTSKLDYLHDLGVDCLWILPMYPSPLRDDGYDIADFYGIHPSYGSVEDFQKFLDAAHERGLRVIADLVMNHTSDAHPWFQAARSDPASPYRDYYVWSDTDRRYREARIIFTDTEKSNWTFDPVARQYYWHRFFSHQPDLNWANPPVPGPILDVMRFCLDPRLVPFPLLPALYMGGRREDRLPITDIFTPTPAIPPHCQWCLFLRNHDELTLEMVTNEERDYMYYAYASDPSMKLNLGIRRRLAPLMDNDRRPI